MSTPTTRRPSSAHRRSGPAWDRPGSGGGNEIIAVLDTGIWPEHPSFSPTPSDGTGTPIPVPPPPLSGTRACQFSGGANPGPAFTCNNKLIGAQRLTHQHEAPGGGTRGAAP